MLADSGSESGRADGRLELGGETLHHYCARQHGDWGRRAVGCVRTC